MIKINLLPPELRGKRSRDKAPSGPMAGNFLAAFVVIFAILVAGSIAYYFWNEVSQVSKRYDAIILEESRLRKQYNAQFAKNEEMKKKWDRMKIQEEILKSLVPDNPLLWSEKMNMISNAIPPGVYVTQLAVEESTDMVETNYSKQQREDYAAKKANLKKDEVLPPEPPVVKKPIIKQTLSIKAAATGRDENERFDKMLEFERSLKSYTMTNAKGEKRAFMDNFVSDISIGTAESTLLDGKAVWAFEFKMITKGFSVKEAEQQ